MGQLTGKTALVAGAGRNNGKAISIAFAREGADLILVAREKKDALNDVVKECESLGAKVLPIMADVSDHQQVERLVQQGLDRFGQIDVLMSCTGRRAHQDFWQISYEEWDKTFAVCWGGVYNGSRAFMPMLVASTEGHIVNTSSVNGFWASLGPMMPHTAYSAAKFAVKGFTEALIVDLRMNAPHVKASVVMPGHRGYRALGVARRPSFACG